jgi:hypothetical protein
VKRIRFVLAWVGVGIVAALVAVWAFPRAYPLFPTNWQISKQEAELIGLERLRDLGDLPATPYVITRLDEAAALEHRLQVDLPSLNLLTVSDSHLAQSLLTWEVTVWEPGARAQEWSFHARVTPSGEVTELLQRIPPEQEVGAVLPDRARDRAQVFLEEQGINLADFEAPEVRTRELQNRTDLFLRFRHRESLLGEGYPYGVEVAFAGDRLAGYSRYFDDPELAAIRNSFQPIQLLVQAKVFLPLILLPLVAIPFVRRYHAGEIGVRRGVQISVLVFGLGVVSMVFSAEDASAGAFVGVLSRQQATLVAGLQMVILLFFPMGLLSFLSWSVGESLSRERHGWRLAAFDALFQGEWANATFARASLRGLVSGLVVAAALWSLLAGLRQLGVWAYGWLLIGPWWESSSWFSIPLLTFFAAFALYTGLFGRLFLVSFWEKLVGVWAGIAVSAVAAVILFFGSAHVYPFSWNLIVWLLPPVAFIILFLRYGIFTSVLASLTASVVMSVVPFLRAPDPSIQFQASLALLVVAIPLIVSAKSLLSDKEFVYRYEDIPPHVRRIAERERQRVELETARGIQASILPDLPPQLHGVKLSHRYLPATEVGGDFYDVLALEDGRLAVAVGDVAGHGVSSGLVMSMAKSALSVQVTFDPEVEAVFSTLNRMVFQSARKRLLATLCYALVDPERGEMFYASAGHLFPYRLSPRGDVQALESVSYPLGVRENLEVRVRAANLDAGDVLFLFSDGVVEAHAENSEDLFGFERLEESLSRHAGTDVDQICEGVLADLEGFTAGAPREDDLTLLVLQIP